MAESEVLVLFKGKDITLSKTVSAIGTGFDKLGSAVKTGVTVGLGAMVGLGAGAVTLGAKLTNLGSNAQETGSLISTSLGGATDDFNKDLRQFALDANRSFFELQEGSSTIIAMTKAMGAGEESAADFGLTFGEMASDLGSFFNRTDAEVFLDLQSALGGSSETLQKYGVDIRETTLKQMALNQGLIESASDILPPLTRATLIQEAIQSQASDAMGDAIRTSDSWANSLRGLKSRILDTATEAGSKLLPALSPLLSTLGDLADQALPLLMDGFEKLLPFINDAVIFVQNFVTATQEGHSPLNELVDVIVNAKDEIIAFVLPISEWIRNNVDLIETLKTLGTIVATVAAGFVAFQVVTTVIGIFSALGAAIAAITGFVQAMAVGFALAGGGIAGVGTVLSGIVALIGGPVTIAIAAITGLVALFTAAWINNWGGIQEKTESVIQFVTDLWQNTLLPALTRIWEFLIVDMMPVWIALWELLQVAGNLAITVLQGLWENILLPAMNNIWTFIQTKLMPIFREVWSFIKDKLGPIFQWLKEQVIDPIAKSFDSTSNAIQNLVEWINRAKNALENFELPDVLTPGSPTPFELGLRGINEQMNLLATQSIPQFNNAMQATGNTTVNAQRTINQNFTVNTSSIDIDSESRAMTQFTTGGI